MARRAGVTKGAVTKACRPGGRLAAAVQGSTVNVLHPAAKAWLALRAPRVVPDSIPVDAPDAPDDDDEQPPRRPVQLDFADQWQGDLSELEQPLTELTERYGSAGAFQAWVKSRKMLEEARKAEMLRSRIEGRLIPRTTVVRMVDHFDSAFRLLLSDAPRTIAVRLGCPDVATATAMIRDVIGQSLEAAQSHVIASLESDDPMAPLQEAAE